MTYKLLQERGLYNESIKFKKYIFNQVGHFKNVKIYDFQFDTDIITELNNYKDISHYHQDINLHILKNISKDKFLVKDGYENIELKNIKKVINNYNIPESVT